jgi:protein involved in polysaccharide export with SLBB domain
VRPDGKITMPLIGDIEATGRTPIELRDAMPHR